MTVHICIAIQTSMFNACMTLYCNQLVRIVWYMHIWQYSYRTTRVTVQTDCKDERVMCIYTHSSHSCHSVAGLRHESFVLT